MDVNSIYGVDFNICAARNGLILYNFVLHVRRVIWAFNWQALWQSSPLFYELDNLAFVQTWMHPFRQEVPTPTRTYVSRIKQFWGILRKRFVKTYIVYCIETAPTIQWPLRQWIDFIFLPLPSSAFLWSFLQNEFGKPVGAEACLQTGLSSMQKQTFIGWRDSSRSILF